MEGGREGQCGGGESSTVLAASLSLGPVLSSFLNFMALNTAFSSSHRETLLTLVSLVAPSPWGFPRHPQYSEVIGCLVWTLASGLLLLGG